MSSARAPETRTKQQRTERIEMRCSAEQKELLEHAASLQGQTVTEFVLTSARQAAEQTVRDYDVLHLTLRDARAFVDTILDPPPPAPRLLQAMEHHKAVLGGQDTAH